ncbi:MAG: S-methyl-5-thioribose kinase [Microbacteriaceae bacterium]|nr:S-methyl-5-thioribose kinase [Microbacteriaceae bacterium]
MAATGTTAGYEFLTESNLAEYIASSPELSRRVDPGALTTVEEIGDGNLNVVFRVRDARGGRLILKQALPYVRMSGEGWPMTPERARREAESLAAHHALVPELVVDPIRYDPERYILAMEDLSDHAVWRGALIAGERHEGVAAAMGRYVAAVAVGTSVLGLDRTTVSERIAATQNPELCVITEDLVFTEPAFDAGRNSVIPPNEPDAAALAGDPVYRGAMAEAKWRFMTRAEALIHGDLHTGSIMVRKAAGSDVADSVKAFDSEFAFYGPVGYDLGALYANYAIAAARSLALGEDEQAGWAIGLAGETAEAFAADFRTRSAAWPEHRLWDPAFAERRIDGFERDAWLFGAAKMARRIVGAAKTRDIETLPEALREGAARGVLNAARALSAAWDSPHAVGDFAELVLPILKAARTTGR